MKEHYIKMITITLLMSLLISVTVWGTESEVSENASADSTLSDNYRDNAPDVILPVEVMDPDPFFVPVEEIVEASGVSADEANADDKKDDNGDKPVENETSEPVATNDNTADNTNGNIIIDTAGFDNFSLYVVSVDGIKLEYLDSISRNLVSINEVLRKYEKDKRNTETELSRVSASNSTYQERVLSLLSVIAKSISGNEGKALSLNEIMISVSLDEYKETVSEDMEKKEVSENNAGATTVSEDDVEIVQGDEVSDNSVSKADIDRLHEDNERTNDLLKGLFFVNLFGVLFMALLVAGQLEQIIFKRLRG